MRKLPSLLLVLVVAVHYGYALIADFYPDMLPAAKAWASVLRALEAATLYLVVWRLVPLKPATARLAVGAACAWGAIESMQIAVCRLAYPMDRPPPEVGQFAGLCDKVTGWPIYMITITIVILVAVLRKS